MSQQKHLLFFFKIRLRNIILSKRLQSRVHGARQCTRQPTGCSKKMLKLLLKIYFLCHPISIFLYVLLMYILT